MPGIKIFATSLLVLALSSAPASADPLPGCANTFNGTDAASCQLRSTDPVGLRFEKRVTGTSAQIRILAKDGSTAQTITEPIDGYAGSGVVLLQDLDGDGRDDLLLSLTTGGAHGNPDWAVWRAAGNSTQFQRVEGKLFGSEFWSAGDGYTAAYGSGGGWGVSFSKIENGAFVQVASVGRQATAGVPDPGSKPCSLQNSSNLDRYGLTKQTAEQKFCALALPQLRARGLSDYSG
ncbi:hypothetical protein [Segniliparus rugosus]|uniref:FG-GAP repeat protein n=1 Tax=Segniliparus rugosus (strain ATCC BAA-974 / DSM 45345 / CCUG 50838 / CIP 108380 / JCM 13579 / CDC 945) TaxID=679197 RepID=E5XSL8_SEGRC|nr:hypothetical protein [Segniliparus rugosus]EFV12695.1 hypothetical protein HMPREF9336_02490 [Segniliparus rugosus ATCC BAA-974]